MDSTLMMNQRPPMHGGQDSASVSLEAGILNDYSPLGFDAGDDNLYRYVGNDPVDETDPSGLKGRLATEQDRENALAELKRKGASPAEISFRMQLLKNVANGADNVRFPSSPRTESRNPQYWVLNKDGEYIPNPKRNPTDAINNIWKSDSGIQCNKYSAIIIIKTNIDFADKERLGKLNDLLRGKVIPNQLENEGEGTFFTSLKPKNDKAFQQEELLPGDQVWFENPYFDKIDTQKWKKAYAGEEGSNVFYIGNGLIMIIYTGEVYEINDYKTKNLIRYESVKYYAKSPSLEDFQIKSVRRSIVP